MENKSKESDKICFICRNCGPAVSVIVEHWSENCDGPHTLDIVSHEANIAVQIGEPITIKEQSPGKQYTFSFCSECNQMAHAISLNREYAELEPPFEIRSQAKAIRITNKEKE